MKVLVEKNTLCLIVKDNKVKCLKPGKHFLWKKVPCLIINDSKSYLEQGFDVNAYFCPEELLDKTETITVEDGCFMIRYVNNIRKGIYKSGVHQFLKTDNQVKYTIYTKDDFELTNLSRDTVIALSREGLASSQTIQDNTIAILYVDGIKTKTLNPGGYVFNILNKHINIRILNMNICTIAPQNQELLTKDKIGLRINFWVNYRINSVETILNNFTDNVDEMLRNVIQMALRSAICNKTLDEVLLQKELISEEILSQLHKLEEKYGVIFLDAGIKDVILPGEIREIMNTVLIAEKKAQANVITRREETASTRSLLNTAKLMEENEILYRLKELEMMERIFEKVGSINVSGSNFLESLELLMGKKR